MTIPLPAWRAEPVETDTFFEDVNIIREDGLAVGVAVQNGDISPDEAFANATLMAAAPDLLAVCQAIVSAVEDGDEMAVVDAARAAIAKATLS